MMIKSHHDYDCFVEDTDVELKCCIPENLHNVIQQFYLKVIKLEVNDHYHRNRPHSHHPIQSNQKENTVEQGGQQNPSEGPT